jgi:hypothetical protein
MMKKEKEIALGEANDFINSMMIVAERNNIDFNWFISEVIRIIAISIKPGK